MSSHVMPRRAPPGRPAALRRPLPRRPRLLGLLSQGAALEPKARRGKALPWVLVRRTERGRGCERGRPAGGAPWVIFRSQVGGAVGLGRGDRQNQKAVGGAQQGAHRGDGAPARRAANQGGCCARACARRLNAWRSMHGRQSPAETARGRKRKGGGGAETRGSAKTPTRRNQTGDERPGRSRETSSG